MNYAIILAGGIGSRFWPLSTHLEPKQFLSLCSDKSLLEESIARIGGLVERKYIYIATNKIYRTKVKDCIRRFKIPAKNLLFEPESKNTLAPIVVLTNIIFQEDKEAIILVLPSDHLIKKKHRFSEILKTSIEVAKDGYIVTLGIIPKGPETGYGYIKIKSPGYSLDFVPRFAQDSRTILNEVKNLARDSLRSQVARSPVYSVDRFIEKPGFNMARRLIKDKRYYWNAGIFIFKAQTLLEEMRKLQPKVYKILMQIKDKEDLNRLWSKFPTVSIDYAIMEKTKKIALLPADCGWIDLGSWKVIEEIMKKDKDGNIFIGRHLDIGSRKIIVWSDKRLVATLGLENVIIVDTKDAILVCSKDKTQEVRQIVKKLNLNPE